MRLRLIKVLVALGLLLPGPAQALELTDETQLKLAGAFIEQGEYYRAVTELKRLAILFPDSPHRTRAYYGEALANYLGERYEEAAAGAFQLSRSATRTDPYGYSANLLQSLAHWRQEQQGMALAALNEASKEPPPGEGERLACMKAVYLVDMGNPPAAKRELELHLAEYPGSANAQAGLMALEGFEDMEQKSPALAGTLSAVLPGAGYAYVGRWGDASAAFILNVLFAAATYELLEDDQYAAGYLVGAIGLGFYAGNIYGSVKAAEGFNLKVYRGHREDVVGVLSLQLVPPGF